MADITKGVKRPSEEKTTVDKKPRKDIINYRNFEELTRRLGALEHPGRFACTKEEFEEQVKSTNKPSQLKHPLFTAQGDLVTTATIVNVLAGKSRLVPRGRVEYRSYNAVEKALKALPIPGHFPPEYDEAAFQEAIKGKIPYEVCHPVLNANGDLFEKSPIGNILRGIKTLQAKVDFKSYNVVCQQLLRLAADFPTTYTSTNFDATVSKAELPTSAIHPVLADGRIIDDVAIVTLLRRKDLLTPETRQAMVRYEGCKSFLEGNAVLSVVSTLEDMKNNTRIAFKCNDCDTTTEYQYDSFQNKRYAVSAKQFCPACERKASNDLQLEAVRTEIMELNGHVVTACEFGGDRVCVYTCGNCQKDITTTLANLRRSVSYCNNCESTRKRLDWDTLCAELTDLGFPLAMDAKDYVNNKSLRVMCPCGNSEPFVSSLFRLRNGAKCSVCKPDRIVATICERYGEDITNVFQATAVKEAIVATNLERHGVPYPQMNPEINKKTQATCLSKYGVRFAFEQQWVCLVSMLVLRG